MNFSEALEHIKRGGTVRRSVWQVAGTVNRSTPESIYINPTNSSLISQPVDDFDEHWMPWTMDIMADDWEVVE